MEKKLTCFIVVGRMGKSLVYSKVEPFLLNESVYSVYIFSESPGICLPKVKYITLPEWIGRLRPQFLSRIIRIIIEPVQLIIYARKLRPVIINGYHIIPKGINALIAARLSGAKCIISLIGGTVEVETYSKFRFVLKPLNILALKKADLITTKGSVVSNYLQANKIDDSRIIIYNGSINTSKFYYDPAIKKQIDIIFVGTFRHLKGPDRVVEIVALVKKKHPEIKVTMIGSGYLEDKCRIITRELDLEDNIEFPGYVNNISEYFKRSKLLVMPSVSEGLPTSMLEAMACGCVPVVSNVGNIRDVAVHHVNSCLIEDYCDIDGFAENIRLLLENEAMRNKMAENGIRLVRDNYCPGKQSEIVRTMLNKIMS